MAYRTTPHERRGLSPNLLMLGREINLPVDIKMGRPAPKEEVDEHEYAAELRGRLGDAYTHTCANLGQAAERQKLYYDVKASGGRYKPGDAVWLLKKDRQKGVCPKLQKKWKGPAVVEDCVNYVTYRLRISPETFLCCWRNP